jgi:FAD/FMN-containing dehydrogenase
LVTIEPGVTLGQLHEELRKNGCRVAAPLFALPSASVISTYLDREPLITAADFIYGNELIAVITAVMPNGELFTVGHPKRGNPPKAGTAPSNIDGPGLNFYKLLLGSQGTMGIATLMVLRVLPMPKEQRV